MVEKNNQPTIWYKLKVNMMEYLDCWLKKTADETPNDMELGNKLRNMLWQTENKGSERTKEWIVEQYNRNRAPEDWVEKVEDTQTLIRNGVINK